MNCLHYSIPRDIGNREKGMTREQSPRVLASEETRCLGLGPEESGPARRDVSASVRGNSAQRPSQSTRSQLIQRGAIRDIAMISSTIEGSIHNPRHTPREPEEGLGSWRCRAFSLPRLQTLEGSRHGLKP